MSVTLVTKEGKKYQVSSEMKNMSKLIQDLLDDGEEALEEDIPLAQISNKYLESIIDYC